MNQHINLIVNYLEIGGWLLVLICMFSIGFHIGNDNLFLILAGFALFLPIPKVRLNELKDKEEGRYEFLARKSWVMCLIGGTALIICGITAELK